MKNNIQNILKEKQLQQKDVALKIGTTPQYFNRVVKGKINPSVELALNIANSLDVLVEDLWSLEKNNRDVK